MYVEQENSSLNIPSSIKWTVIVGIALMTLATVGNTVYNIYKGEAKHTPAIQSIETVDDSIATPIMQEINDTVHVKNQ